MFPSRFLLPSLSFAFCSPFSLLRSSLFCATEIVNQNASKDEEGKKSGRGRQLCYSYHTRPFLFFLTWRRASTTNQLSWIQKLSGINPPVTSEACNVHSGGLAPWNETELWSVHLSALRSPFLSSFFFFLKGAIVQSHRWLLCFSRHVSMRDCVLYVFARAWLHLRQLAPIALPSAESYSHNKWTEGRKEDIWKKSWAKEWFSLWLVEICIVSSFSCQHFFELPQREEEEEGRGPGNVVVLFYPFWGFLFICTCRCLFFAVHMVFFMFSESQTMQKGRRERDSLYSFV